ncbi:MAG: hypothetical protein CL557_12635 [Alphaproteobacteria bacterium]|nr:hypothetical protein [Alphaproteobacteria bacterium]|tara:strand:+ start:33 stop:983 length:951 start_codon:yes stop_codon:yes gene_type:complete
MGDQFNMSMPGEPQIGLPGNHMVDRIKQESGVEMQWGWAAASFGLGVLGAIGNKKAADKSAKAQNDFNIRQFEYDTILTDNQNAKMDSDYAYAYDGYLINKKNQETMAKLTDEKNLRKYNYDLQIRNAQQKSAEQAYAKSERLYHSQLGYNQQAAAHARERSVIKQQEIKQKAAFDNEDSVVKSIEAEGQLAVLSQSGRSSTRALIALRAERGKTEARLAESLVSSRRDFALTLKEISRDKYGADLAAFANRMLKPGELPMPIKPLKTPIPELQAPKEIEEHDYLPDPIMGVKATGGSWLQVASQVGSAIPEKWYN